MNSKILIIGIVASLGLLFGGLLWMSRPVAKPQVLATSIGKLTASETSWDFDTVSMAKGVVTKKFSLANTDTVPATVTKLFSSCMCTKAALRVNGREWGPYGMPGMGPAIPDIAAEIAPGQTAEVEVTFDPAAHGPAGVGQIERQATLQLNGQSPLTFNIRALVTP